MSADHSAFPGWWPSTAEERLIVLRQVERIAGSSGFRASKKYPALLRGIVELALDGKLEHLKERSLGIAIFGRDPDYDTSSDPVVRVVAAEVRKRIGQYYYETPPSEHEIVIDMPLGSYAPRFRQYSGEALAAADGLVVEAAPAVIEARESPAVESGLRARGWRLWRKHVRVWHVAMAIASILPIAAELRMFLDRQGGAVGRFWGPLLEQDQPVLILLGGALRPMSASAGSRTPAPIDALATTVGEYQINDSLTLSEATALSLVTNTLGRYGKPYSIQRGRSIDLTLLRTGPMVAIGAFNNPWTLRLTKGLRFTLINDIESQSTWIADSKNPGMRDWRAQDAIPYRAVTDDFAIIARLRNSATEHPVLILAGLKIWGTLAAGEFVANSNYLEALARKAPAGWKGLNLEAVIHARVINGVSGPPQLVAVEFW